MFEQLLSFLTVGRLNTQLGHFDMAEKKSLEEIDDLIDTFNTSFRNLFEMFKKLKSKKFKNKLYIREIKNKIDSAIRTDPTFIIITLGPYIWADRNAIATRNTKVFTDRHYNVTLMNLSKEHDFEYEDALQTVKFMIDSFSHAKEEKKEAIIDATITVLGNYAMYASATK